MDLPKKSSRSVSPECHLEKWKSVFLGPGVKNKCPKKWLPFKEFKFWSELNGPFEAGVRTRDCIPKERGTEAYHWLCRCTRRLVEPRGSKAEP
jgi:hypothetical protein